MLTPAAQLGDWLILALGHAGGDLSVRQAWQQTEEQFGEQFTEADRQPLRSNGQQRWQNRMAWERHRLVQQGVLRTARDAGRGTWSLTEEGWKRFERLHPADCACPHRDSERAAPLPGQFFRVRTAVDKAFELVMPSSALIEAAGAAGLADPLAFLREYVRLQEIVVDLQMEISLNGMGFSRADLEQAGKSAAAFKKMNRAARLGSSASDDLPG